MVARVRGLVDLRRKAMQILEDERMRVTGASRGSSLEVLTRVQARPLPVVAEDAQIEIPLAAGLLTGQLEPAFRSLATELGRDEYPKDRQVWVVRPSATWGDFLSVFQWLPAKRQRSLLNSLGQEILGSLYDYLLEEDPRYWVPLRGPQAQAYENEADTILFGGAAGGGKTDLAIGLALTQHQQSLIIRREGQQLHPMKERMMQILGTRDGLNSATGIWRVPPSSADDTARVVRFGGVPTPGTETRYQGASRDLLVVDEAANLLRSQVRFLLGWVRSTDPSQRCRALLCSNPPTSAEGQWILEYFAPWLQDPHPNPAEPGELRWFATINDVDTEVESREPFVVVNDQIVYDFDPDSFAPEDVIHPQSRTFIPSRITDNPFLLDTGYLAQLQSLSEPLRSQMLYGDFLAGLEDDVWQVIPSDWVQQAMDRWEPRVNPGEMSSMGVDVNRGGKDEAVISRRHGQWYAELETFDGEEIKSGPDLGSHVLRVRRDAAPVHVDVVGVGASVYDYLDGQKIHTIGVSGAEKALGRDKTGIYTFRNRRSELYWAMREALDPKDSPTLALPPDPKLKADLCAPTYAVKDGSIIAVEPKVDLVKRIGRSPDRADAVINASIDTVKKTGAGFDYSKLNLAAAGSPARRHRRNR